MSYAPLVWLLLISTALLVGIAFFVKRYSDVPTIRPFFHLFNIVPIARNAVMENMDDIFIVLDIHGNIVDFNRAAQITLAPSPPTVGASPTTLSQPWAAIFQHHADTSSYTEEITLELDGSTHAYELTISQIQDKQSHNLGKFFLFHDITKLKQAENDEREQRILAEALRDTAEALNSTLNFDSVLEKILENVERVVPIDAANIALLEGDQLHYVRFHGYEDYKITEMETVRLSLGSFPIYQKVFETGEPAIIPDTHADPDWIITPIGGWIRSFAVMPIRIKEKVVGVLNLDGAILGLYTPEYIDRLRVFADQVAIAVENARLFATAERQIKERKHAEEQLHKLSQAVEQSPVSIVITDTSGRIEYVNPRFVQLTGYALEEAIGENPRILKTEKTDAEIHRQLWETISAGKEWQGEFINRKKNGDLYYESALISPIIDSNGVITHYLAVKEDITERKLAEEKILLLQAELREQAIRDPLTGLYNRRYLNEFMEHELARAARERYSVCFVMIDIDHFKKINDDFGHDAGDSILRKLANQLQSQARVVDIICRYGGEEFLAILPNVTAEIAYQITQRWRLYFMGSTLPLEYNRAKATISCGISEYPAHGTVGSELIILADKAMYQAKANGRNQVVVWQAVH
jgi:diguanylate cyclase (GGDEF)-like protein/PAS domain S-box-containing protein